MSVPMYVAALRSPWGHALVAACAISAAIAERNAQPHAPPIALYRCTSAPLVLEMSARGESLTLDLRRPLALRVVGRPVGAPVVQLPVNEDAESVVASLRALDATRALPTLSQADLARHRLDQRALEDGASVLTLDCGARRESLQLGARVSRDGERVVRRLRDGRAFVVQDDALRRLEHADVLLAARAVWPIHADAVTTVRVELPRAPALTLERVADGTDSRRFRSAADDLPESLATALAESCLGLRAVNARASRPPGALLVATLELRSADDSARIRLWCSEELDASCVAETAISHSHLFVLGRESVGEILELARAIQQPP